MKTVPLGTTGRSVSRIGLGAMHLSIEGRPDPAAARAVVRRAVELGVDLIDTADVYCLDHTEIGHNERLVAAALREAGAGFGGGGAAGAPAVVVATKGGLTRPYGRLRPDGRPEHLRAACEASLRALGVERIDLYQLHAPDPAVPFADSVGALARLREEGRVAAVGLSNVGVAQIRAAQAIVPVTSVQNQLGPWDVTIRRSPVVEFCRANGITFLPYAPLGGSRRARLILQSPRLAEIGRRTGHAPAELVLAWLLHAMPGIVPIPGASRVSTVESSVRAASIELDDATAAEIRRAFSHLPGRQGVLAWAASGLLRRVRRLAGA
jgi:aryl-alcohol dehydrogenase-like predicted oxidoreductase